MTSLLYDSEPVKVKPAKKKKTRSRSASLVRRKSSVVQNKDGGRCKVNYLIGFVYI